MALLKESWDEKSGAKRALIIVAVLLLFLFTGVGVYWVMQTPQGVLFRDLEPQNAANIVSGLDRLKIDYELRDGGTTVLVDQNSVQDARLKLLSSGVQLGGAGFELFDETEFGMTEFAQHINFQRALQGELSRTINALDAVKHSRVHLVLPERGLFKKKKEPATASVILFLNSGAELEHEQITGIQQLVASSVPELEASMVTVLNDKGVTLSRVIPEDDAFQIADMRLRRKKEIESYLNEKVQQVVDRSVGHGNSVTSVDAVLNFDNIKTTYEKVLPNEGGSNNILRKHESHSEGEGKKSTKSRLVNSDIEYALGKHIEQIVKTPGSIEKLSIGVLISKDLSQETLWKIRDLVSVSIGLDSARGDVITVSAIEPAELSEKQTSTSMAASKDVVGSSASALKDGDGLPHLRGTESVEATLTDSTVVPKSAMQRLLAVLKQEPAILMLLLGALCVILLLLIVLFGKVRVMNQTNRRQLSDQERQRVLKLLEEWLEPEEKLLASEVKRS